MTRNEFNALFKLYLIAMADLSLLTQDRHDTIDCIIKNENILHCRLPTPWGQDRIMLERYIQSLKNHLSKLITEIADKQTRISSMKRTLFEFAFSEQGKMEDINTLNNYFCEDGSIMRIDPLRPLDSPKQVINEVL
jgi:hypothetical protein